MLIKTSPNKKVLLPALAIVCTFIAVILFSLSSCSKGTAQTQYYVVTEEDAAEIISNSVLSSYGGLLSQVNDGITLDQKPGQHCGLTLDTVIVAANAGTTNYISFNKSLKWQYQVNCTDHSLTGNYTGSCSYNGLHFSATDQCNGSFALTIPLNLQPTYQVALTMSRTGVVTKKAVGTNTLQTGIDIKSSNLSINYSTKQVISGQMVVSISIASGVNYSYAGTVNFLGGGKATLTLNSGTVYQLTL